MRGKYNNTEYLNHLAIVWDFCRSRKCLLIWLLLLSLLLGLNIYFGQPFSFFRVYPQTEVLIISNGIKIITTEVPFSGINFSQHLIKTKTCKIPAFNPRDDKIKNKVNDRLSEINCGTPPLTEIEKGQLIVQLHNLKHHSKKANFSDISCCYQEITRDHSKQSDSEVKLSSGCTKVLNGTLIVKEFIRVECTIKNVKSKYINYHYNIPDPVHKNKSLQGGAFNVMFVGLDSISRLNFERHLPATRNYLVKQLKAVEMFGYTKIGDNTFPNLLGVLRGQSEEKLRESGWNGNKPFDNITFLWDLFSNAGYQTMYGEDTVYMATFNYLKKGFWKQPTDYYLRPFLVAAEDEIANKRFKNTNLCLGPKPFHQVTLDYGSLFMEKMQNESYFGFLWSNSLTHDDFDYPQLTDDYFLRTLSNLYNGKHLQKTILFVLSDHGMRWGAVRETLIGEYEVRLPAMYVYLPEAFRKQFPKHYEALQINSRRLTSPYDIYHTVIDILKLSFDNLTLGDSFNVANSYGISLFNEIPDNRSCEDVGISFKWCACEETENVDVNNTLIKSIALFIVDKINELTEKVRNLCAVLILNKIRSASRQINAHSRESMNERRFYRMIIDVAPSEAIFEVIVEFNNKTKKMTINKDDISRTNLYGNQSSCVNQLVYKYVCFCTGQ